MSLPPVSDDHSNTHPAMYNAHGAHDAFKARFSSRNVTECIPEQNISLEPYKGKKPNHQRKFSIVAIQAGGKALALSASTKKITFKPVPVADMSLPDSLWNTELIENNVDIYLPEQKLLTDLNPSAKWFKQDGEQRLFSNGVPEIRDIAQLHKRSTCYLLSTLAAYISTPIGNELIKRSLCQFPDGLTGVTFHDEALAGRDVKILISSQRPVDADGNDYYSFSHSSGAYWPGYFEKAYHAFLLGQSENVATMKQQLPEEDSSFLDSQLRLLTGNKKSKCLIDHMDMSMPIGALPAIPKYQNNNPEYTQASPGDKIVFTADLLRNPRYIELIKYNIQEGIPVIMGTRSDFAGGARSISSGTPPKHAVAVIGPAENDKGEEGFLVYDPYGESLSKNSIPNIKDRQQSALTVKKLSIDLKSKGQSTTFRTYSDITEHYERVCLARGGFVYNRHYQPPIDSTTLAGENPGDEWEMVSTTSQNHDA